MEFYNNELVDSIRLNSIEKKIKEIDEKITEIEKSIKQTRMLIFGISEEDIQKELERMAKEEMEKWREGRKRALS